MSRFKVLLILAACTSSRIDCHDPSPIVATPAPPATPAQTVGASTGGTKRADKASSIEEAAPLNDLAKVELYAGRFEAAVASTSSHFRSALLRSSSSASPLRTTSRGCSIRRSAADQGPRGMHRAGRGVHPVGNHSNPLKMFGALRRKRTPVVAVLRVPKVYTLAAPATRHRWAIFRTNKQAATTTTCKTATLSRSQPNSLPPQRFGRGSNPAHPTPPR